MLVLDPARRNAINHGLCFVEPFMNAFILQSHLKMKPPVMKFFLMRIQMYVEFAAMIISVYTVYISNSD